MGGEGATPYEVLLHAAMVGESSRFTRQDGVEETWRIMQPLLDGAPPVHAVRTRDLGPGRRPTSSWPATAAGASPGSSRERRRRQRRSRSEQSAARPRRSPRSRTTRSSPTATRARSLRPTDRSTGSACRGSTHRASSAACSIGAPGRSRFAPFGIDHPTARAYEPGTNVLETTWKTPSGWVVVRTALTMGPRDHEDQITPHTRPPADDDADHVLVRTVECLEGRVEIELICEPVFDYGREAGRVDARRRQSAHGRRDGRRTDDPPADGSRARHRGRPGRGPATSSSRATARTAPSRGRRSSRRPPTWTKQTARIAATTRFWRRWLGRARIPDHRWRDPIQRSALAIKGLTLHADGGDGRGAHHVAARDARAESATGTTATPGCATRRSRSKRCTTSTWTGRPTSSCSSSPMSSRTTTAGCRSCTGSTAAAT